MEVDDLNNTEMTNPRILWSIKAPWFNSRDGSSSNISGGDSVSPNPAGEWDSPPMQDNEDWVLCLVLA